MMKRTHEWVLDKRRFLKLGMILLSIQTSCSKLFEFNGKPFLISLHPCEISNRVISNLSFIDVMPLSHQKKYPILQLYPNLKEAVCRLLQQKSIVWFRTMDLSQHWNASLYRIVGHSIQRLVFHNLWSTFLSNIVLATRSHPCLEFYKIWKVYAYIIVL